LIAALALAAVIIAFAAARMKDFGVGWAVRSLRRWAFDTHILTGRERTWD